MVAIIPTESLNGKPPDKTISFRWVYVILPLIILLLSIILTGIFFALLPGELVYQFKTDSPENQISRGTFIAWMLITQFFFSLLAAFVVWGAIKMSTRLQVESSVIERLLSLMGNMVALPQIILGFFMLDTYFYNAFQINIMPLWMFALIVLVIGGIVLGISFIKMTIRQFREQSG